MSEPNLDFRPWAFFFLATKIKRSQSHFPPEYLEQLRYHLQFAAIQ